MVDTLHKDVTGGDLHEPYVRSESDPGAIGAGKIWLKESTGARKMRNAANDGWIDEPGIPNVNSATRTLVLNAAAGWPSETSGCADPARVETSVNKVNYFPAAFDASADEYMCWAVDMPDNYNGGTLTARFHWTASGGSAGTVRWALQALCRGDDDPIDAAYGTAQEVDDAWIADGDEHISAATGAITPAGTPGGGKKMYFRAFRNADHANDTFGVDALLISVHVEYGVDAWSD